MAKSILNIVNDTLSDKVIDHLASSIGENSSKTKSAISAALPTVLKGIINRGDTSNNVTALRKYIKDENLGGNIISRMLSGTSDADKEAFSGSGGKLVNFLFGSAKDTLLGNISKATGLSGSKSSSLTGMLAPLALNAVGAYGDRENLSDEQFSRYLDGQKGTFTSTTTHSKEKVIHKEVTHHDEVKTGGGGFLKWLFPLLAIGALVWYMAGKGCAAEEPTIDTNIETPVKKMEQAKKIITETPAVTTTPEDNSNSTNTTTDTEVANTTEQNMGNGLSIDADGNIVDMDGNIIVKAGEFSEKDGYYVDKNGRKIGLLSKIGSAIGSAAVNSADAFKKVFSGLFSSKEKVGTTYSLSKIMFDDESHKIIDFSKNEVEGLANALKAYPDAKIQVQVHSNDGKNSKENSEFTKMRAEVVHDMLVTLGVSDKQISFKGMGDDDESKASEEKVEIMVEQTLK